MKIRFDAIDCWRGFALLTIFIDHMPDTVLAQITYHNFGFSDAAEAFVFLSGVSVALAYAPRLLDGRIAAGIGAIARRLLTIYAFQVLLSLLAIAMLVALTRFAGQDAIDGSDAIVLAHPVHGLLAILSLSLVDYSNILPLYIVLLALAPVLIVLARIDERLMLAVSVAIYVVARAWSLNIPSWPTSDGWFFNPFAYQLLFSIGLLLGRRLQQGGTAPVPYHRALFAACIALLGISAVIVTNAFGLRPGLADALGGLLDTDKQVLGTTRLVHFLALAYVVQHSGLTQLVRRTPVFAPLALMGRHSLPVFATGAFLTLVATQTMDDDWPGVYGTLLVVIAGLAVHYGVAWFLSRRRTRAAPAAGRRVAAGRVVIARRESLRGAA